MLFGEEDDELDEEMTELFHDFVDDGNTCLGALNSAEFPDQKDFIAKEAHKLKGSASNFGFAVVADQLGRIEDEIASIDGSDFAATLAKVGSDFETSVKQVFSRFPAIAAVS